MTWYQSVCVVFFICITTSFSLAKYGKDCYSPKGQQGKCVPVKSCRDAFELFSNMTKYGKEKYKDDVLTLQQSRCDSDYELPLICCAKESIQMNPAVYNHLKNLNCGKSGFPKVARGDPAGLFDFRWMVLLKYNGKEPFACGGSLIDDHHVLTAAHCLHNFTNLPIAVRIGEYDLGNEVDCSKYGKRIRCLDPPQDIGIKKIIVHDDYIYKEIHNDIAILRLERPANTKTKSVCPICLPINEKLQTDQPEDFMVSGWGMTEFGNRSNILLWTSVPTRSLEFCKDSLGLTLSDEQICAGGRRFHDSCKGDSGGPLFYPNIYEDGVARSIQYGIVSVGARNCGEVNVPAVYTSIPHYMQWITDHIRVEGDD